MGSWGEGVYDNDHAMDIISEEVARIAAEVNSALRLPGAAWSDIQGPLVYVDLLARLGEATVLPGVTRAQAVDWREGFLRAHDHWPSGDAAQKAFHANSRKVVEATFERLLRVRFSDDP